jgi:hypothetical protein
MKLHTYLPLLGLLGGCLSPEAPPATEEATPHVRVVDSSGAHLIDTAFGPADLRFAASLAANDLGSATNLVAVVEPKGNLRLASDLANYCGQLPSCPQLTIRNIQGNASPLPAHDQTWAPEQSSMVELIAAMSPQAHILVIETPDATDASLALGIQRAIALGASVIGGGWSLPATSATSVMSAIHAAPTAVRFAFPVDHVIDGQQGGQNAATAPTLDGRVIAIGGLTLTIDGSTVSRAVWNQTASGIAAGQTAPSGQPSIYGVSGRAFPDATDTAKGVKVHVPTSATTSADVVVDGNALATALQIGSRLDRDVLYQSPYALGATSLFDVTAGNNGTCGPLCSAGNGFDAPSGVGFVFPAQ